MMSRILMTSRKLWILMAICFVFASIEASTEWEMKSFVDENVEVPATRRSIFNSGNNSIVTAFGKVAIVDRIENTQDWIEFSAEITKMTGCLTYLSKSKCIHKTFLVSDYDVTNWIFCGNGLANGKACHLINKQTKKKTKIPGMKMSFDEFPGAIGYITNTTGQIQAYGATCEQNCRFQQQFGEEMSTKKQDSTFIQGKSKFVHVTSQRGMSYLFYSETHENYDEDRFTSGGKKNYYAMVARVCDNDPGRTEAGKDEKLFTTFAKIRLLCPYEVAEGSEGGGTLYFDVLKSVVQIDDDHIYGLFELPGWWRVKSSAICKFSLSKLDKYFDGVEFGDGKSVKGEIQYTKDGGSISYGTEKLQPGQCPYDNKAVDTRNEISRTIHRMVKPIHNQPILVREMITFDYMTSLTTSPTDRFHSIFLIKRDGTLEKHRIDLTNAIQSQLLIQYQLNKQFNNAPVLSASYTPEGLLLATDKSIYLASPSNCGSYPNCENCNNDPDCEWTTNYTCVSSPSIRTDLDTLFCGVKHPQHVENLNMTWQDDDVIMFSWGSEHDKFGRLGLAEKYLVQIAHADDANSLIYKYEKSVNLTRHHSQSNFTISKNDEIFEPGKYYTIEIRGILGKILSEKNSQRDTLRFYTPISPPANVTTETTSNFAKFHWKSPAGSDEEQISIFDQKTNKTKQNVIVKKLATGDVTSSITIGNLHHSTNYLMLMTSFSKQRVQSNPVRLGFQTAKFDNSSKPTECENSENRNLVTQSATTSKSVTSQSPTSQSVTSPTPTSSSPTSSSSATRSVTREAEGTEISTTYSVAKGNGQGQVKRVTQKPAGFGAMGVMMIIFAVLFIAAMVVILVNYKAFKERKNAGILVENGVKKHEEGDLPAFLECCVFIPKENSSSASSSSRASSANDDIEVEVAPDTKSDVI